MLNCSTYVAEMLRTSLAAVNTREIEAARTLGFSKSQAFFYVALPQALKNAKPIYKSIIINLIQWTSVVSYITIADLTKAINNIASRTMEPLIMIVAGMIIYIYVRLML